MTRPDPSVTRDALADALLTLGEQSRDAFRVLGRRGTVDLTPLHASWRAVVAAEEAHDIATEGTDDD
jgi:hypothetical protein